MRRAKNHERTRNISKKIEINMLLYTTFPSFTQSLDLSRQMINIMKILLAITGLIASMRRRRRRNAPPKKNNNNNNNSKQTNKQTTTTKT